MPVVHRYKHKDGAYVLTRVRGNIVTFQLSKLGEQKLVDVGVVPDKPFARALLFDLWLTGDAFTRGSGVGEPITESLDQLVLDFAQDPDPETLFPCCDNCGSLEDLHLSILREQGTVAAKLQHPHCRDVTSYLLETCIPIRFVTLSLLERVLELKAVLKRYDGLDRLEKLLRSEFESKWEELRKLRRASQKPLFDTPS